MYALKIVENLLDLRRHYREIFVKNERALSSSLQYPTVVKCLHISTHFDDCVNIKERKIM